MVLIGKESSDIECPFCDEGGFDLIGLKDHLLTGCQKFDDTISIAEELGIKEEEIR